MYLGLGSCHDCRALSTKCELKFIALLAKAHAVRCAYNVSSCGKRDKWNLGDVQHTIFGLISQKVYKFGCPHIWVPHENEVLLPWNSDPVVQLPSSTMLFSSSREVKSHRK